ncbi:50S ribosomal protein L30 [Thermosipho africanus H17ap60334]|jgi:large subunit ribosomal protein L30|uniref:Large ribosomal subunit protein uL30 n=2 Tax=Thermosipho TaxID=2420 RepID=RL30_THEAB|nr:MULTISPECIES: 50S ribosomal protein L30 [Thermosipho]B7IHW4.1 RecName: Full=Large ribosomal subunit protein uL30; AltName: Full=50S ribosomal protein L30 [Thermosipho africanus TCF52B]HCF38470.1 50S ribosomal protein L30 [Thermosipho africanus]ACJ75678.1 ribosomal protein L30 [Thermosipho africanus TCF52B]EKF49701.1 50S ribosomal protein L30 [Thermosipho africanus H17ap60334]MBB6062218.1 large subunit ribosomal protein L30 [Thermosipho japonicus]MBZ4650540.1 rpmD [Thermosipho sp. (in: ther
MKKLKITLVKSPIGYKYDQKDTVKRLGLRKLNSTVIKDDVPQIRGMIRKVRHLVKVEEIEE